MQRATGDPEALSDFGRLVLQLVEADNFAAVDKILAEPSLRGEVTVEFFHSIIYACQMQTPISKAAHWFAARMGQHGFKCSITMFNRLISLCMEKSEIEEAKRWWHSIHKSGVEPNRTTYDIMIRSCAAAGDASAAEGWLKLMAQAQTKVTSPEAFNSVINSCARAGQLAKAEHWFKCMYQSGIQPDERTYNYLMHACGRSQQPELAKQWYNHMKLKGFRPDMITFSTLISSCAKAGNVDLASRWLEEMVKCGYRPNAMCYNCLLRACTVNNDVQKALHVWKVLVSNALAPNTASFNWVISCILQAGELLRALEWIEKMLNAGVEPDSFTQSMLRDTKNARSRPNINSLIRKVLQVDDFEQLQVCIQHMKRLQLLLSPEMTHELILGCLNFAFRSLDLPFDEAAGPRRVLQSLLPNLVVSFNSSGVVLDF